MPEYSRGVDYLYLHANVSRRVSNLETGVHPTRSETGEMDTYSPTLVPITGPLLTAATSGVNDRKLRWQRTMGLVSLMGGVMVPTGHTLAEMAATETIATLVAEARPPYDLTLKGGLAIAPYFFTYTVTAAGVITVVKPAASSAERPTFYFDGVSWGAT